MKKPAVLAALGAVAGMVVALALFMFVFGGTGGAAPAPLPPVEPTVVKVPGKIGPHLKLDDRIFNLTSPAPVYLKLQMIIEFETTDARWYRVLSGCKTKAALPGVSAPYVSAAPLTAQTLEIDDVPGAGGSACELEEKALLAEFESSIGTGRKLVEDAVTTIVTAKTPQQVGTTQGKEQLKAEIKKAVEELLKGQHVTRVLFVNFITQ